MFSVSMRVSEERTMKTFFERVLCQTGSFLKARSSDMKPLLLQVRSAFIAAHAVVSDKAEL